MFAITTNSIRQTKYYTVLDSCYSSLGVCFNPQTMSMKRTHKSLCRSVSAIILSTFIHPYVNQTCMENKKRYFENYVSVIIRKSMETSVVWWQRSSKYLLLCPVNMHLADSKWLILHFTIHWRTPDAVLLHYMEIGSNILKWGQNMTEFFIFM